MVPQFYQADEFVRVAGLNYTVKTFWLLQPYFGHLSCMPDVCVTHYKTSKGCFLLNQSLSVVEKLLSHIYRIFLQKAYSYLVTLLPFLPQPCNQSTPPGADVQDQRNTDLTRNAVSLLKGDTNLTKGEASQVHYDSE